MTHEREITDPIDLCDSRGRLQPDARGWSRRPLHRANLRGRPGRKKRWDYWCVIDEHVTVSVTYADIDYLGLASLWILDHATGHATSADLLRPLGAGMRLPDQPCTGAMRVTSRALSVEIIETRAATELRATAKHAAIDLSVEKPDGHESTNVVIPWSDRTFQYTSKQNARAARGTVRVGDRTWELASGAYGVLDLGRGIWPYRNRWNWAAASGIAADGSLVGLQFGGKWTVGTGFTENGLYVGGRLTKVGEELEWEYDWDQPLRPWRVRSTLGDSSGPGQVDLTLAPTYDKHSRTSLGILSMEVHQVFGTWSGTVVDADGRPYQVDGIRGFAEEARNRW